MKFLKCIFCGEGPVNIFFVTTNGVAKSKCSNCGLNSTNESERKDKIKRPEVIYK